MENILNIVFSSTVVVAIISYYQWNQTKKLERITDKREEINFVNYQSKF